MRQCRHARRRDRPTSLATETAGLALDRLGIPWTQMNAKNISVAKREAVARLDEFVGAKY
jgi:hypothetical protein